MASVTSKDIPEIFNMFGDVFTLLKKYYNPEPNDEFWNEMHAERAKIQEKYNTDFCHDLLTVVANDIGRREVKGSESDGQG